MAETPNLLTFNASVVPLRPRAPSLWSRALEYVLVYGLALGLMFGPLAFGAVQEWSVFVLEAIAASLFLIWLVRQISTRTDFDYLQALVETGVLGFAAVIWFLIAMYRSALKKLRLCSTGLSQAATLAALLGITGILVHSFSDFNLQVPANAAIYYVLCAIAGTQVEDERTAALERRS